MCKNFRRVATVRDIKWSQISILVCYSVFNCSHDETSNEKCGYKYISHTPKSQK